MATNEVPNGVSSRGDGTARSSQGPFPAVGIHTHGEQVLLEALRAGRVVSFEWDLSTDTVVRSANADEIFGPDSQRDTGTGFFSRVHPADRDGLYQTLHSLTPGKPDFASAFRYARPKDGSEMVLETTGRAEFDPAGKAVCLRGLARDVTDQKRVEVSEARLRALLDHNPALVFMKDEAGRYVYVNDSYEQRFIHSKGWFGKTDFDFWERESAELFRMNDAEVLRCGEMKQFLEESRDGAGKRYCWLCYKFPFTGPDGQKYVGGVGIDATRQIEAEEALRETEERYRRIVETTEEGIATHAPDGTITYVNQRMARMLGYAPTELVGRSSLDFVDEAERQTVLETCETLKKKGSFTTERKLRRKDGTLLWTLCNMGSQRTEDGKYLGYLAMHTDITKRKRTEEKLRASEDLNRRSLQALPAHIAVLDRDGRIIAVNRAWEEFASQNQAAGEASVVVGANYLDACRHAVERGDESATRALTGIEEVLRGREAEFSLEYPCHSPQEQRWFYMTVGPLGSAGEGGAVITHVNITERRRAEQNLRRSRDRFELLSGTMSRLLMSPEPQSIIEDLCNRVREFLGCAVFFNFLLDSKTGRLRFNSCGGVDPRLARKVEALELGASLCGTAAQGNCRVLAENILSSSDPRATVVRSLGIRAYACHPLLNASGEAFGTLSFGARDRDQFSAEDLELMRAVTDHVSVALLRRRAEEALSQSEARYRALADSMPQLVWTAAKDGTVDYRNAKAASFYGQQQSGVGDWAWHEIVHPEDLKRTLAAWEAAQEKDQYQLEHRLRMADGSYRWHLSRGVRVCESAASCRWFGTATDIHDLKSAEAALQESEKRFRVMADGTPLAIWVSDAKGDTQYVNRAYREFFGVNVEEVEGRKWLPLLHSEDQAAYLEAFTKALREHSTLREQIRVRRHDGVWRWIEAYAEPRFGADGEFLGMAGSCPDVTEQKEFEAELQRMVGEKTANLHEMVGELEHFSYTITHDLKSPLRAMRGFAEMMSLTCGECERTQAKEFLGRISTAAERMDRLIADALNFSRSVRQELPLEEVDTEALLRGMLESYPELQPEKARIRVEGLMPVVVANQAGLTQVFSNFLGNAVKFVRQGQKPDIRVWAEIVRHDPSISPAGWKPKSKGGWARIWVEDKGIGISPEMLPRVFDMFSRESKDYEGTGIGLALVRKVAQRMEGRVGVESQAGKGSRFWIELRRGGEEPASPAIPSQQEHATGEGTVLYVEDEESDAEFMQMAFAEKGLADRLRVVNNGRAAIQYLSGAGDYSDRQKYPRPALVLLDLNLPQISGFEVLEWIRNNPEFDRLPVVVFSSSTRQDDQVKARELGAEDFLAKPNSGLKFGDVVEHLRQKWLKPA